MSCQGCNAQAERPTAVGSWPSEIDTVIVGNGPSALILSYILHGNIPFYDGDHNPHPDPLLHGKLRGKPDLLLGTDIVDDLTEHFGASRFPYSTQALPVNVLLDTLLRPHGETDADEDAGAKRMSSSCVAWRRDPARAVPHLVVGTAPCAGGQWEENPIKEGLDIGTLSYANMLSLPGYSFAEHYAKTCGKSMPAYLRPPRRMVAGYLAAYPFQVGIEDVLRCGQSLSGISRSKDGFYISSHGLKCRRLVLASGVFSELIPPRPLLQPLLSLSQHSGQPSRDPLLVIGSGFTAADVIISSPPSQNIIHLFKWAPATSPSPLRACHSQAYPEYAGVYRGMKLAAISRGESRARYPNVRRPSSTFDNSRDWTSKYEGFPNTVVLAVESQGNSAIVTLQKGEEPPVQRRVSGLAYVVGRRGSLDYLSDGLRAEVSGPAATEHRISGQTLRAKALDDLEVAPNVFITGSLTGDSLIRYTYGSCAYAAGRIMQERARSHSTGREVHGWKSEVSSKTSSPYIRAMNGLDGHSCKLPETIALPVDGQVEELEQWS